MSVPLERYLNDDEDTTAGLLSAQTFCNAIDVSDGPQDPPAHSTVREIESCSHAEGGISRSERTKSNLHQISPQKAQQLLLLEFEKREPLSKQEMRFSMGLVQAMGFLPLVINAVAQRLKTTKEPLSNFAKTYSGTLRDTCLKETMINWQEFTDSVQGLILMRIISSFVGNVPLGKVHCGPSIIPANI